MDVFSASSFGTYSKGIGTLRASRLGDSSIVVESMGCAGQRGGTIVPTLTGDHSDRISDYTAVCVGNGQLNQSIGDKAGALNCMHDQQSVVYENSGKQHGICDTLDASYYKGTGTRNGYEREYLATVSTKQSSRKYVVRRLTPLECCRLQGFPDWWENGVEGSDSARYKMWGNGIALPCAADVLGRVAKALRESEEWRQANAESTSDWLDRLLED